MNTNKFPEIHASRISILELLSGDFKASLEAIPPEVLAMSEQELNEVRKPTSVDYFIRKKLWSMYDKCQAVGLKEISTKELYDGICSHHSFYERVMVSPHRLAWIFIRPNVYDELIDEAFYFGMKRMRDEVLTMPITEKTMGHFMKAIEFLANRALGPVIQRIESKNVNLSLTPTEAQDPHALEMKLLELKEKMLSPRTVTHSEPE
jgi:hypothetical protein